MTRRAFPIALASLTSASSSLRSRSYAVHPQQHPSAIVTLIAHVGAHLPRTISIAPVRHDAEVLELTGGSFSRHAMRDGFVELRTYRTSTPRHARQLADRLRDLFPRAGIAPGLQGINGADLTYLIRFPDLTARDRAWTLLTTDPGWSGTQFRSYHFGLYCVA